MRTKNHFYSNGLEQLGNDLLLHARKKKKKKSVTQVVRKKKLCLRAARSYYLCI